MTSVLFMPPTFERRPRSSRDSRALEGRGYLSMIQSLTAGTKSFLMKKAFDPALLEPRRAYSLSVARRFSAAIEAPKYRCE